MKRDMDLIRRFLMAIEDSPEADGIRGITLDIEDRLDGEVMYHVQLLVQAGFIEARDGTTTAGLAFYPRGLTWEGHEFLEKIRKDTLWEQAKSLAIKTTGGLSLEALKVSATLLVQQAVSAAIK